MGKPPAAGGGVQPAILGDAAGEAQQHGGARRQVNMWLVGVLFSLSGGTALLYQVAFGKKLATLFGATAYAVSAVLAAFMGGLALGSHLGGKYGGRIRRPLLAYGVVEILVGGVCAVTPWLFAGVALAYGWMLRAVPSSLMLVSGLRGLVTAAVVLAPTVAMGVTLPLLARAVAGSKQDPLGARRRLATLYALNTAGGALGALLSAYVVLPSLGLVATMRVAALVNVAIGLVAIARGGRLVWPGPASVASSESAASAASAASSESAASGGLAGARGYYALAALSGLLVFSTEVVDTHLLTLLIGNSAYAFGLMLAAFLTCLSIGATMAQSVERRLGERALVWSLVASAITLLLTIPLWGQLPRVFLFAGHSVSSWAGREFVRASVVAAALCLPTTCMGLTFPLLLRRVAARDDVARRVGRLSSVNTVGSIAGSLLSGYLILPLLGSQQMLRLIALCFALGALGVAWLQRDRIGQRVAGVGLAVWLVAALLLPSWDMILMTNGANVYFDTQPEPDELVFVREDVHGGLTSVARRGKVLTLYTNGKFQGDNGGEVTAQQSFAHFPSLFVKDFRRALVIGLGTGTTLGTIAGYPYERIDVAEISPSIIEAAGLYFTLPNRNSLADPRVHMHLNDGRNVLLFSPDRYDLITIELTSVWFAGAANLYSEEFYRLCRERLTQEGILQQWVQLHHIKPRELAVVLRTLRTSFEHVALFVSGGQGIVVASAQPLVAERARLRMLDGRPGVAATLSGATLESLLERLMFSGAELDRFVADVAQSTGGAIISTDDNLYLEYATPKGNVMNYQRSYRAIVEQLARYRTPQAAVRHLR